MIKITRIQAVNNGDKKYFTGAPCRQGHVTYRYTANYRCIDCNKIYVAENPGVNKAATAKYRNSHKEEIKEAQAKHNLKNKEAIRLKRAEYVKNNREAVLETKKKSYIKHRMARIENGRKWAKRNIEQVRSAKTAYRENNRGNFNAYAAKRRASKLMATPLWADMKAINAIYSLAANRAKETKASYHVDHIIPLQGKLVSGLHIAENLQILLASNNMAKSNKF